MQLNVSPNIAEVLEKAAAISANQGNYFVGVNHVFAALLDSPDNLPESIRERQMSNLFSVQRETNRKLWGGSVGGPGSHP